ncbi:MAG: 3-oxoacyl-[acyl-carrier-protein] reductase [Lachnospiraceae bacterium]|nr:3-oxoacyl-[acyl-carrier-protein] reductase [Lachnospiraceae bacterium]
MLENKVALVTGASRGIGRAIAVSLAEAGAYVIVNYAGSEDKAQETLAIIRQKGGDGECFKCDIADENECSEMCKAVLDKHGKVDILVNNAGITRDKLVMAMSDKDFMDVINTNLLGAFHMIRNLSRNFLKLKGGRIINIASVSGVLGNAGQANYSSSKAGIIGLTKSVAREFAGKSVCVNAVAPGFIQTDMTDAMPQSVKDAAIETIPMKKMGEPEDIAATVRFLASEEAKYITGQVICVDGGMAI